MKDGLSLEFATTMFQTWLTEKGIGHISSALRKAQLEKRLLVSEWSSIVCSFFPSSFLSLSLFLRNFFHQRVSCHTILMNTFLQ